MRPSLSLKLSQQLTLTPQLKQALKLLTLSNMELESELQELVAENPLLEMADPEDSPASAEALGSAEPGEDAAETDSADRDRESEAEASESNEGNEGNELGADDAPLDVDASLLDHNFDSAGGTNEEFERQDAESEDLRASLIKQLELENLSSRDLELAHAILDALDPDGFLRTPLDEVLNVVVPSASVEEAEVVRRRILRLDPAGIAARDLRECLLAQLAQPRTTIAKLAFELIDEHMESLARGDRAKLMKLTFATAEQLEAAIRLIRSLDPKPGRELERKNVEYLVPDVFVVREGARFVIRRNSDVATRLKINSHYQSMAARSSREDGSFLKGRLQEARWLIKSLEQREESVSKVAQAIVESQQGFFEKGAERLRPLVMREVAELVGLHESTISRVTTRKYLHCCHGVFEFKFFFSSGVATLNGDGASVSAIQSMIKKLIDEEPPRKPLSDAALEKLLKARGVMVARRTVAKYREGMGIPSSNARVRL
jgi:RNA polymerase sigma-54 factor